MTCVVGIVSDGGEITIGADSMATNGWDRHVSLIPKVFIRKGFIIGYTSSFRMGQLLRYQVEINPYDKFKADDDPVNYMVSDFIPSLMKTMNEQHFSKVENNVETGGQFMVGFAGRLFVVYDDFQVQESQERIEAIGAGANYALGSIYSQMQLIPFTQRVYTKIVLQALEAAACFCNSVCSPFRIHSLGDR